MIKFLIESRQYDFANQLINSIDFINWFRGTREYGYTISKNLKIKNMIPVGSLEFVSKYSELHHGKQIGKPIHIPDALMKDEFLLRRCGYAKKEDIIFNDKLFIKSVDRYKGFIDYVRDKSILSDENYFFSEIIDIAAEYRCFIYKGELKGIHYYSGDFKTFPNIDKIEKMIHVYEDAPLAYTLDVGVNGKGTFVIEVHPLVSCGLYGFKDKALPHMMIAGYKHILKY